MGDIERLQQEIDKLRDTSTTALSLLSAQVQQNRLSIKGLDIYVDSLRTNMAEIEALKAALEKHKEISEDKREQLDHRIRKLELQEAEQRGSSQASQRTWSIWDSIWTKIIGSVVVGVVLMVLSSGLGAWLNAETTDQAIQQKFEALERKLAEPASSTP